MEKEENFKDLKSCSNVIFSIDSDFSPFFFLTFLFFTGYICGERLSEVESKADQGSHRKY